MQQQIQHDVTTAMGAVGPPGIVIVLAVVMETVPG
jgi:hypothetical protein